MAPSRSCTSPGSVGASRHHSCGDDHLGCGLDAIAVGSTLFLSLLMIPVMRRLRREFDTLSTEDSAARPPVDVTPWQRQVVNAWRSPAGRPSGKDWGSAGDRGSGSR